MKASTTTAPMLTPRWTLGHPSCIRILLTRLRKVWAPHFASLRPYIWPSMLFCCYRDEQPFSSKNLRAKDVFPHWRGPAMKSMVPPSHSSEKAKSAISLPTKTDNMLSILRKIWIDIKPIFEAQATSTRIAPTSQVLAVPPESVICRYSVAFSGLTETMRREIETLPNVFGSPLVVFRSFPGPQNLYRPRCALAGSQ